jgi:hypothetical protein
VGHLEGRIAYEFRLVKRIFYSMKKKALHLGKSGL